MLSSHPQFNHKINLPNNPPPSSYHHLPLPPRIIAGFLLYPTNFPETGCITLLKAMACGAFPITSRFTSSVLQNITQYRRNTTSINSDSDSDSSSASGSDISSINSGSINNDGSPPLFVDFDLGPRIALNVSTAGRVARVLV